MSISRLNYKFYSPIKDMSGNIWTYQTDLPFIMDEKYYIPEGLTQSKYSQYKDKIIDYGGNISNNWFIGLSVNGNIAHVCGYPAYAYHDGVLDDQSGFSYDEKGKLIGTVKINKDSFGVIAADAIIEITAICPKVSSPWIYYGLLEERSKVAEALNRDPLGMGGIHPSLTPCQALKMSYFVDGYVDNATTDYMNAIKLLTSSSLATMGATFVLGADALLTNIFMMFDVIDGKLDSFQKERVMLRSLTNFNLSQLAISQSFLGGTANVATELTGSNYKNIHSRRMEYETKTYKENQIIKDTIFYIVGETKEENNDFYLKLSESIYTFLPNFIDFESCIFNVYGFQSPFDQITVYGKDIKGQNQSDVKLKLFSSFKVMSNFKNNPEGYVKTNDMSKIYKKFLGYKNVAGLPVGGLIQEDLASLSSADFGKQCCLLFVSDMNFPAGKITQGNSCVYKSVEFDNSKKTLSELPTYASVVVNGVITNKAISIRNGFFINEQRYNSETVIDKYNKTEVVQKNNHMFVAGSEIILIDGVWLYNTGQQLPEATKGFVSSVIDANSFNVFIYKNIPYYEAAKKDSDFLYTEDNSIALVDNDEFGCYVLSVLKLFNLGNEIVEDDLFVESVGPDGKSVVDANLIEDNCVAMGTSFKKGGKTMIDRIKTLYSGSVNVEVYSSGGDKTEMRYWRKKCPIGSLYHVSGYIDGNINSYANDGYWFDFKINNNPENKIVVYVEGGSTSNFSDGASSTLYDLQGRIFYSPYFVFSSMSSDKQSYFNFDFTSRIKEDVVAELQEWYRLPQSTILFLLDFEVPVLVVRANVLITSEQSDNYTKVPSVFNFDDNAESRYLVSPLIEDVNDYIYMSRSVVDTNLLPDKSLVCLNETEEKNMILFHSIQFDIENQVGMLPTDLALVKENEYYIRYKTETGEGPFLLWKIKSNFTELNSIGQKRTVKISLHAKKSFKCTKSDISGKVFKVYTTSDVYSKNYEKEKYVFCQWNPMEWAARVKVGDTVVTSQYTLAEDVLSNYDCVIDAFSGELYFKEAINDKKKVITLELVNITDNKSASYSEAKMVKSGGYLDIYRASTGGTQQNHPLISNIKINIGDESGVERVECQYYSPMSSFSNTSHYISPAWGFKTLENDSSWTFTQTESQFHTIDNRINGTIDSPTFFIDYFEDDSNFDKKMLNDDSVNGSLASIDRRIGNITSNDSVPYMEVMCVSYEPAILPTPLTRIANIYDSVMNRILLLHNNGSRLNEKYSYLEFIDKNDPQFIDTKTNTTYIRENLNETIPVVSKVLDENSVLYSKDIGEKTIEVSVQDSNNKLIGLVVEYNNSGEDGIGFSEPVELYAEQDGQLSPFGYKNVVGDNIPCTLAAYKYSNEKARSFTKIPDTSKIDNLKLFIPSWSKAGTFLSVKGQYASSIIEGYNPNIYLSSHGNYYLFFLDKKCQRIRCLKSFDDGMTWQRPNYSTNYYKRDDPITIYKNSYGISNLLCMNSHNGETFKLFFYDEKTKLVNMIAIPENLLDSISQGYEDTAMETSLFSVQDKYTIFSVGGDNSWNSVFDNPDMIYTVYTGGTRRFGVVEKKDGNLFAAVISESEGQLKVVYTEKISKSDSGSGIIWKDTQLNLMDEKSCLYQFLWDKIIYSLTLDYSSETDSILHFYITTSDGYLVYYGVPFSVLGSVDNPMNKGNLDAGQEYINSIRPVIIVGEPVDAPYVISTFTQEPKGFSIEQSVSTQWSPSGKCYLFYYGQNEKNEMEIRSLISDNTQTDWSIFNRA